MNPTYVTFAIYLLFMVQVGQIFSRRSSQTIDNYILGGRSLGSWVTAFSAQASDMSGWLLMGLPGAIYMAGSGDAWVAIGLLVGTLLNWLFIAPRLRVYTGHEKSLTLSSFFAARFRDPSSLLRIFSAIVVLLFFSIYAASGLVGAGKLFENMFNINYKTAVIVGTLVILAYTILGGYLAVCWTDLVQGALMFIALVFVPVLAYFNMAADNTFETSAQTMTFSLFPDGYGFSVWIGIISCAVWGLGYCGQPHILCRFMSIKSAKLLPRTTVIAMVWVTISLAAAVVIGVLGRIMIPGLDKNTSEKVFIEMIDKVCYPWIGGIFLAAILAAIMSTIDSQLLVSSSTLTSDFYHRILHKTASSRELVIVSRGFVILITGLACILALSPFETIFGIVKFAWGGFGAAFGPVIIMALYSRRTTWQSALAGMIVGTVVMVVWYFLGWNKYMYEILPGFCANLFTIIILNFFIVQRNPEVLQSFDKVKEIYRRVKAGEWEDDIENQEAAAECSCTDEPAK